VTPRNTISRANTKKVYGHRSAKRTTPMSGFLAQYHSYFAEEAPSKRRHTDGAAARDTDALAG
jgi:hypothetical protein